MPGSFRPQVITSKGIDYLGSTLPFMRKYHRCRLPFRCLEVIKRCKVNLKLSEQKTIINFAVQYQYQLIGAALGVSVVGEI